MRYRFLMSLFGMSLDKVAFKKDFGVSIDQGLAVEMAFMRTVGAYEVDNSEVLVPSAKGRYLLVSMMREFFVGVNNLRDQARNAISTSERELLFGDGETGACCDAPAEKAPLAGAEADTETAQELPVP
jgi:hypothetical protein